jgi:hypothetical protein
VLGTPAADVTLDAEPFSPAATTESVLSPRLRWDVRAGRSPCSSASSRAAEGTRLVNGYSSALRKRAHAVCPETRIPPAKESRNISLIK